MKELAVIIDIKTQFLTERSFAEDNRFIWSYEVTIKNNGDATIQLLNRYWRITEQNDHVEEVRGSGVVGLQPVIKPGRQFTYTSYCQLTTPQGSMEGYYEMQTLDEEIFLVKIPLFLLASPILSTVSHGSQLH